MGMPGSYYGVLGLNRDSSIREIRSAYRKLTMKWHPDKCSQSEEAKRRFQQIREAYEVLSDQKRRTLYDAGLYFPEDEEDEGFTEFLQEMMSLMEDVNAEGQGRSVRELQRAFKEMVQGFQFSQPSNNEGIEMERSPDATAVLPTLCSPVFSCPMNFVNSNGRNFVFCFLFFDS